MHDPKGKLFYLDLKPDKIVHPDGGFHHRKALRRLGPKECFKDEHLYTLFFGKYATDIIEKNFFGPIDNSGSELIEFFANYHSCDQAVEGLREARVQHLLSRSLIVRTALHRIWQDFPQAWNDLNEAQEIALRGEIKLYLADCHLEACRLYVAEGKREDARQHLNTAKTMIDEMGYHRRDKEVEELTTALYDAELSESITLPCLKVHNLD